MNEFDALVEVLRWLQPPGPREAAFYRTLIVVTLVVVVLRRRR